MPLDCPACYEIAELIAGYDWDRENGPRKMTEAEKLLSHIELILHEWEEGTRPGYKITAETSWADVKSISEPKLEPVPRYDEVFLEGANRMDDSKPNEIEYTLTCNKCGSSFISSQAFPKPQLCPKCLKSEPMPYHGKTWMAEGEETRKALAEGQGITFANAQEAIRWLKEPDESRLLTDKETIEALGVEDTVLGGCEVICIGEQPTDLIACPLTREEQLKCKERRQYQAGREEVVKWLEDKMCLEQCGHSSEGYFEAYYWIYRLEWWDKTSEWRRENG